MSTINFHCVDPMYLYIRDVHCLPMAGILGFASIHHVDLFVLDTEGGEAELRRMSVAATHRGRGVSQMLLAELQHFCIAQGYKRIVLSTSSMQMTEVRAYPQLGFRQVKETNLPSDVLPLVQIHYFARDLDSEAR